MLHQLTLTVDDAVYETLKPMVEQQTISLYLHEFMQSRAKNRSVPSVDNGSLAYLFQDYIDDGIREPLLDFGQAVGNEQW